MKSDEPKIGIFCKIGNDLLIDTVPLAEGEPYGEAIQYGGHYDFHETLNPLHPTNADSRHMTTT